ncbi:MAG: sodium ion-translocating decarboxylase subunit beta, partial [Chromatocurvus sp.]
MERLSELWTASGLARMDIGAALMIAVGLLLLFLAIRKNFEPLLLVPIGFGGILANIPGAGMAYSAVENALYAADPGLLSEFAALLALPADAGVEALREALSDAGAATRVGLHQLAVDAGFADGMLYTFYRVTIASGIAPLVIFMGVGAMTDFGPLLAHPRTLFLGAAAQFGIFATLLGAVGLTELGLTDFTLSDAAAIGIIGGADGPTAIYV